jgi:hypothetical protein
VTQAAASALVLHIPDSALLAQQQGSRQRQALRKPGPTSSHRASLGLRLLASANTLEPDARRVL